MQCLGIEFSQLVFRLCSIRNADEVIRSSERVVCALRVGYTHPEGSSVIGPELLRVVMPATPLFFLILTRIDNEHVRSLVMLDNGYLELNARLPPSRDGLHRCD